MKITEYNEIDYTEDQLNALKFVDESIIDFKANPRQREIIIAGYAGTGKTTILQNIIKYAIDSKVFNDCVILAPTNRAKLVAASKIDVSDEKFSTLHSFLYKAPDADDEWRLKTSVNKFFIVVEEASMLSGTIKEDLVKACYNSLILYIGDGFQLEPIGNNPKLFANADCSLKEVKRNDGDILDLSIKIREENTPLIRNAGNIEVKTFIEAENYFLNALREDKDIVFITATNKVRMKVNKKSRVVHNAKNVIVKNERLISVCNSSYFSNGETTIITEDPLVIHDEYVTFRNRFNTDYTTRVIVFKYKGLLNVLLPDLDKASFYHYNLLEADYGTIKRLLTSENIEYNDRGNPSISKEVNIFTYGYAITAHKSQGGQFNEVIVYFNYCAKTWNPARWFYTAITRAEEKLILIPTRETRYE